MYCQCSFLFEMNIYVYKPILILRANELLNNSFVIPPNQNKGYISTCMHISMVDTIADYICIHYTNDYT